MSILFTPTATSSYTATGVAAANFDVLPAADAFYMVTVTAACLVKQGPAATTPVASAGDGSTLVTPEHPLLLHGANGDTVSIIRVSGDGVATLTKMQRSIG